MAGLLTTASVMMCPHGGTVIASPSSTSVAAASPILAIGDTCTIAGCTFNPGTPHPCVTVQWMVGAARVSRAGASALNASSLGMCLAADQTPQGSVVVASTQASVTGQ